MGSIFKAEFVDELLRMAEPNPSFQAKIKVGYQAKTTQIK